jgi:hypothetical protein
LFIIPRSLERPTAMLAEAAGSCSASSGPETLDRGPLGGHVRDTAKIKKPG